MAFILTHYESRDSFVSTVELPHQWQADLKPDQKSNLSLSLRVLYNGVNITTDKSTLSRLLVLGDLL
jgi:hypothetical protein|tara:strand:+ start:592 stop:792 length:201 start_codon:yes stop_codon:yes gene_type:complete